MNEFQAIHAGCIMLQAVLAVASARDGNWPLPIVCMAGILFSVAGLVWFSDGGHQ